MKNKNAKLIVIMFFTQLCLVSGGETLTLEPSEVDTIVSELHSDNRDERCGAISQMTETVIGRGRKIYDRYSGNEKIRLALIDLLTKTDKRNILGEGDAECYSDLATIVASLKDIRAVPILLENIVNSDVVYYLAETKDPRILERMIDNFYKEKKYPGKRHIALEVMSKMYVNGMLKEKNKEKVRIILREALDENECYFKIIAIRAIVEVDDEHSIPALENIAKTNGCTDEKWENGKAVLEYPAREEAQKALKTLNSRQEGKQQRLLDGGSQKKSATR